MYFLSATAEGRCFDYRKRHYLIADIFVVSGSKHRSKIRFRNDIWLKVWKNGYFSAMRNTSKLKLILAKFDVALSMTEEDLMTLSLIDKDSGNDVHFQHKTYSWLVSKAYSHLLQSVKAPPKNKTSRRTR